MLISTIPSDHTSAARGEYVGATLFLHSISREPVALFSERQGGGVGTRTVAHIRCGSAIHISRLDVIGRQSKVCELDDDLALLPAIWRFDPSIGDDKVLGFDVPVKDVNRMTDSDSLTHLREHGGDEA
jgi:hypothetical protein